MTYNTSNKTNFYNDKSQCTNKNNYGLHHTRPDHPNCIGLERDYTSKTLIEWKYSFTAE